MTTLSNRHQTAPLVAYHHPYARLYRAVIVRALQDLVQKEHQDEAREWLLSAESDYAFATAGISPNSIRQQMI
jgi:hypothetical protein